jgi:hypothetical protein
MAAAKPHFVIVFTQDRPIGSRPDPKQHWHKGDKFSEGYGELNANGDFMTLEEKHAELKARWGDDVLDYLKVKVMPEGSRPHPDDRWDPVTESFVDVSDLPND